MSGSLYTNTAVAQNTQARGSVSTSSVRIISSSPTTVALGDHLLVANGVTATLVLGSSATVPDGMNIKIRDINNASANPITLSCAASSCIICPLGAACTAAGGTHVFGTQYGSENYIFSAPTNRWYEL